jgi:4-hydroxy-tetrahydrodipicolinate synthase
MTTAPPVAGVVGALLTPFDGDGGVDRAALNDEIEFVVGHCDAISVLGAEVTEYRALTPAERRATLTWAIEQVAGRRPVLAGVSSGSIAEVAELSELAAAAGATHAQLLLPKRTWGGEPADDELVAYVEAAASVSALPIVAYHNPGWGADPGFDTLVEITKVEGVVAIKDSSRNISRILRAIEEIERAGHARYLTTIQPLLTTLEMGGAGAMAPPPVTVVAAAVRDAFASGDHARAADYQRLASVFPARWARHGLAPVSKAAMAAAGHPVGDPAAPLLPVPSQDVDAIARVVAEWPLST